MFPIWNKKQKKHLMKRKIIFIVQIQDICVKWSRGLRCVFFWRVVLTEDTLPVWSPSLVRWHIFQPAGTGNRRPVRQMRTSHWLLYISIRLKSINQRVQLHSFNMSYEQALIRMNHFNLCQLNFDLQGAVIHLVASMLWTIHRRKKSDQAYEESSKQYFNN